MNCIKRKNDFKTGDWIILKDSYIKELKSLRECTANHFIKSFNYPQKIMEISTSNTPTDMIMYVFKDFKMTAIDKEKFRIANEKDFTEMKLKKIFSTN